MTIIVSLSASLIGILDEDSLKLYTLIWRRTMACQMEASRTELVGYCFTSCLSVVYHSILWAGWLLCVFLQSYIVDSNNLLNLGSARPKNLTVHMFLRFKIANNLAISPLLFPH